MYSNNDYRDYLEHGKWSWPNGKNTPEYNRNYYQTHREEILARRKQVSNAYNSAKSAVRSKYDSARSAAKSKYDSTRDNVVGSKAYQDASKAYGYAKTYTSARAKLKKNHAKREYGIAKDKVKRAYGIAEDRVGKAYGTAKNKVTGSKAYGIAKRKAKDARNKGRVTINNILGSIRNTSAYKNANSAYRKLRKKNRHEFKKRR